MGKIMMGKKWERERERDVFARVLLPDGFRVFMCVTLWVCDGRRGLGSTNGTETEDERERGRKEDEQRNGATPER
jgi:hypothetical protein